MLNIKLAKAEEITTENDTITKLLVNCDDQTHRAINFNNLTGPVQVGDPLIINTTAVDLSLGTGGYHFVISNLNRVQQRFSGNGHIMKLRYTPYQLKVLAAEEQDSTYHDTFNNFESLDHMPVIVGTLHSMLLPVTELINRLDKKIRMAYIMTDGAALPLAFSDTVRKLKEKDSIVGTVTVGNAFGGDLECVNIYNGLIAAKEILNAHIAVVAMGPGIVGTGTKYGFTGIEQGYILDAVNTLGGYPIAVPRISFKDKRQRHQGISHHTMTVLSEICKTKVHLGMPYFHEEKSLIIKDQLQASSIDKFHNVDFLDLKTTERISKILENSTERMSTMGRGFDEDKAFFITCGAAGHIAVNYLNHHR